MYEQQRISSKLALKRCLCPWCSLEVRQYEKIKKNSWQMSAEDRNNDVTEPNQVPRMRSLGLINELVHKHERKEWDVPYQNCFSGIQPQLQVLLGGGGDHGGPPALG